MGDNFITYYLCNSQLFLVILPESTLLRVPHITVYAPLLIEYVYLAYHVWKYFRINARASWQNSRTENIIFTLVKKNTLAQYLR